jgi:hypothetical protein
MAVMETKLEEDWNARGGGGLGGYSASALEKKGRAAAIWKIGNGRDGCVC